MPFTQRVFSGVQPTGNLHLGNYLGAIVNFVKLQEQYSCLYCVVDMHAITVAPSVWGGPDELRRNTREVTAAFIAAGIDPKKQIIFNQSQVPGHAELAWVFNCVARLGWLNRMTQFKDKSGKNREGASVALYTYPVLQAADVLLYQATHVPVGEDQKQHLELTRDIAAKFNHDYGVTHFPITEPLIEGVATRVMSLRDGARKMSKSDPSDASRINLTDDADTIAQKIRKARTDADPLPGQMEGLKDRPEARNLVNIYAALTDETPDAVLARFEGQGFGAFKPALAEVAVEALAPITRRMADYMADPAQIDAVLADGADRAAALATPILERTKEIMGLLRTRA